ncbi:hypothetical protein CPC08DRAFT_746644 [Agrocybe pediades]|nr:hypothetical protein CPC08DRAFT_746644 [Agrocybe pediades]
MSLWWYMASDSSLVEPELGSPEDQVCELLHGSICSNGRTGIGTRFAALLKYLFPVYQASLRWNKVWTSISPTQGSQRWTTQQASFGTRKRPAFTIYRDIIDIRLIRVVLMTKITCLVLSIGSLMSSAFHTTASYTHRHALKRAKPDKWLGHSEVFPVLSQDDKPCYVMYHGSLSSMGRNIIIHMQRLE